MNYFASLVSRHYILVLRAEGSNWFYICKRAVKLSWLSFQYFITGPPPSDFHASNSLFFVCISSCVRFPSDFQIVRVMPQCPGLTTLPSHWSWASGHNLMEQGLVHLAAKYQGPDVQKSIKTLEHKHDPK